MKMIKPAKLAARLRKVHRREQGLNLTMGLLSLCNWMAILFLVGFAIDWFIRLPVFVRMIILVPLLVFPIAKAWRSGWRFFKLLFSPQRTAIKVEDHYQNPREPAGVGCAIVWYQGCLWNIHSHDRTHRRAGE